MSDKTQVHLLTVLIVDTDRVGAVGVIQELENGRFGNDCIGPDVLRIETCEVEWTDEHPLNCGDTKRAEIERLFARKVDA